MGDAEFERLVLDTQDRALGLAYSYLSDWDEARDAVQEAFVKAYRKRGGFRRDAEPATWFFRILSNHCRDRLRRRKVRSWLVPWRRADPRDPGRDATPEAEPDPAPDPLANVAGGAFRRDLALALAALPPRQREAFRLKNLAGLTVAETAASMGISEGAAKAHLFRATRALQRALEPWRDEP